MTSPTPAPTTPIPQAQQPQAEAAPVPQPPQLPQSSAQAQAHHTPSQSQTQSDSQTQENNNNNNNNNSASPQSPALPPPSLTSAGPRATALNRIFSEALTHSLRTCTYANFAACFPTPAACEPDALRELWRMFGGELEERCRNSYDAILTSRNVIPSLNELDRLIADARKRKETHHTTTKPDQNQNQNKTNNKTRNKDRNGQVTQASANPTPPHTLPPHTLYTAHLRPFLHAQHTSLTERGGMLAERNEALAVRIREQREEMEGLLARLEAVVGDLEGGAGALAAAAAAAAAGGMGGRTGGGGGDNDDVGMVGMVGRDEIRELEGW